MTHADRMAAIRAREAAATPGPWIWRTGEKFTTRLMSAKNMGQYVMTFIRRGMQSADVRFNVNGIMRSAHTISVPRREGDADWDDRTLDHPDAVFIAHARADIPYLLARNAALEAALEEALEYVGRWTHQETHDRLTAIKEGTTDAD